MPIDIEPPHPMPAPPLRRKPSFSPKIIDGATQAPIIKLYLDEHWN
ncbi:MAG: hypothetical protein NWF01_12185 [Candidatus Bathyarchaeota archaeon]|nr:hypothetical protein [Candidatus Bathyarchaeota archaeon]